MAGLPKAVFVLILVLGIAATWTNAGVADGIQTDSIVLPLTDVQTSSNVLQPVFDLIDANVNANPIDQVNLKVAFENAVPLGVLTPEQALAMLELVQWETLIEPEALADVSAAIQTILAGFISGALTGDPLASLTQLLNALATPAGPLNAIGKAGASEEILDQVSSLVASGVPPGILVRITKAGLRDGLSMEEITAQLAALANAVSESEDLSWGQIANDVTGKGNIKNDEEQGTEEEVATVGAAEQPDDGDDEKTNNGKKDDNPGKDNKKDK